MGNFAWQIVALAATLSPWLPTVAGKAVWSLQPASSSRVMKEAFPVGNGQLGAMPFGFPGQEKVNLNIDSLWSGGPFESSSYTGGNPTADKSGDLAGIRESIFRNGIGNVDELTGSNNDYGSFRALGNLTVQISGVTTFSHYNRSLDLTTGAHTTTFLGNDLNQYTSVVYCSYPAKVCVYRLSTNGSLPNVAVNLENRLVDPSLQTFTCQGNYARMTGKTQVGPPEGMDYDVIVRVSSDPLGTPLTACSSNRPGTLIVTGSAYGEDYNLTSVSFVIGAGTNYDQTKCNKANNFSCKGISPKGPNEKNTAEAAKRLEPKIFKEHLTDYQPLMNAFDLNLPDPWQFTEFSSNKYEFSVLLERYKYDSRTFNQRLIQRRAEIEATHHLWRRSPPSNDPGIEWLEVPNKSNRRFGKRAQRTCSFDSGRCAEPVTKANSHKQAAAAAHQRRQQPYYQTSVYTNYPAYTVPGNGQPNQNPYQQSYRPSYQQPSYQPYSMPSYQNQPTYQPSWQPPSLTVSYNAPGATGSPNWQSAASTLFPEFAVPTGPLTVTIQYPGQKPSVITVNNPRGGQPGNRPRPTLTRTATYVSGTKTSTVVITRTVPPPRSKTNNPYSEPPLPTTTNKPRPNANPNEYGDPYVEDILFDYARHLFICSSRPGSLPPNMQGVWANELYNPWSGDYHANINLQMNHWFADQVGLGELQEPLFKFITNTWIPRGRETAKLLYGSTGWVTHDEMNIFGHTGMKNNATWANYPAAAAWMMQHIYDSYDYSRNLTWLQNPYYAVMREQAAFWLAQLQQDRYSQDYSMVVNPCNSPEHGPTTFGCANYQQLIHQLLSNLMTAGAAAGDRDGTFFGRVQYAMDSLDKGFSIGSWGQVKEWKLPDSKGYERQGDQHRFLSELVGWYPGYSMSSFLGGYGNATIQRAVATTLRSRGNGNADGNSGWSKMWRSAAWARLNNTDQADLILRNAISTNFVANGLSVYDPNGGPFQIDANFGLAGAMLAMLIVDMPLSFPPQTQPKRQVVLGPAIPKRWSPGNVRGMRVRGASTIDFTWNEQGRVTFVNVTKKGEPVKYFNRDGRLIYETF